MTMLFDEKLEGLIRRNESAPDSKKDERKFIFDRRNILYYFNFKFYRMPIIDLNRNEVRLVETDFEGNYLYDENGKTIKQDISVVHFQKNMEAIFHL